MSELFFDKDKSFAFYIYICDGQLCEYIYMFIVYVLFLSLFPFFCSSKEKNLSRKQTSPLVDGSSAIVCSRVFIFMRRTPLNGKFERGEEQEEDGDGEGEKVRYWRRANEQGGGINECSVILFVYVYVRSLSLVLQLF
jgi:hypothetical protein